MALVACSMGLLTRPSLLKILCVVLWWTNTKPLVDLLQIHHPSVRGSLERSCVKRWSRHRDDWTRKTSPQGSHQSDGSGAIDLQNEESKQITWVLQKKKCCWFQWKTVAFPRFVARLPAAGWWGKHLESSSKLIEQVLNNMIIWWQYVNNFAMQQPIVRTWQQLGTV